MPTRVSDELPKPFVVSLTNRASSLRQSCPESLLSLSKAPSEGACRGLRVNESPLEHPPSLTTHSGREPATLINQCHEIRSRPHFTRAGHSDCDAQAFHKPPVTTAIYKLPGSMRIGSSSIGLTMRAVRLHPLDPRYGSPRLHRLLPPRFATRIRSASCPDSQSSLSKT